MAAELARGSAAADRGARRLLPLVVALLTGAGVGASVCDTANCGKGNCTEVTGALPPHYECHCDPGWSHVLKPILFSPCIVPNCTFDSACLNLSSLTPPTGIPDVCAVVSCGAGGVCKSGGPGAPFSYSCECRQGYTNLLNLTALPCVNCFLGNECSALGLGPPSPTTAPAPSGDHGSSGPSAPPSGTNGNNATHDSLGAVSSPSPLHQLLLLSVAMVLAL